MAFTQLKQEFELESNKARLENISKVTKERRDQRAVHFDSKVKSPEKKKGGIDAAVKNAEKYKSMTEHYIELDELYTLYKTSEKGGLDSKYAEDQNRILGDNVLSAKKKTPWYIKLLHEYIGSFSLLLWMGCFFCFLSYGLAPSDPSNLYLGLALAGVVLFAGTQNFYQNMKSDSIIDSFKNFIPPKCKCLRGGNLVTIDAAKLVPGDIVEVKAGDRIPADIRIIWCQEMKVDNSSLTGESDPLLREVKCTRKDNPLETANLAFFGTLCKEGLGKGVVINIGDKTIIGQIASLASSAQTVETTLAIEMTRFVKFVAVIALVTGTFFFVMGFILGYPPITNLSFGVGVLTAYVPEGLATCVVIALSLTAKKLAKKKVLVKNLDSVETLGSTTCICSDKTGTLTQNRMTVEHIWYDGKIIKGVNLERFKEGSKPDYDLDSIGFKTLHENAILCSDAVFDNGVPLELLDPLKDITSEEEKSQKRSAIEKEHLANLNKKSWQERPAIGDASETALIKFFQPVEDIKLTRSKRPVKVMEDGSEGRIPFNSSWKYALTILDYKTEDSENCILIKGAPERIWGLCSFLSIDGKAVPIDEKWQAEFKKVNRFFGDGGERVLGFAKLHLPRSTYPKNYQFNCKNPFEPNYPMKNFVFSGLVSLIDPPRESVPFAILKCRTAGIKVIMVTGDQPVTAAAIARQVNIFGKLEKTVNQIAEEKGISFDEAFEHSDSLVIHGDMITEAMHRDELLPESDRGKELLKWLGKPRIVFARTTPAQKLIIVKACQQQGHVVAVTGDGVNDSPAIKKADIGIAMGVTGSDVAKDAADMILLSDDFAAIVLGVEEGRRIFDNIKRSIVYILAADITELIPFLTLIILGFPLPLSTILILCVDLGFNIIPSVAWSAEDAEIDIMVRPPRRKHEHLVTRKLLVMSFGIYGVLESIGTFLTYFVIMHDFGIPLSGVTGLGVAYGFYPSSNDVYDPQAPYYGHTNTNFIDYCNSCWNGGECNPNKLSSGYDSTLDWIYAQDTKVDLRLYFLQCTANKGFTGYADWESCHVKQWSPVSEQPACFTTEALKFAQTGLYFSIMFAQLASVFVIKTRTQNLSTGGLRNFQQFFGWAWMLMFCMFLGYFQPLNIAFNTRPLKFLHFAWPSIVFNLFFIIFDEIRKYLIRVVPGKDNKPNWFRRNTYW
jgi:sodium/potassium-transporting ATPase subunit alpha